MSAGKEILIKFKQKWQALLWFEVFLFAMGPAILVYFIFQNFLWAALVFLITTIIITILKQPWNIDLQEVSGLFDQRLENVQYSSGLLLLNDEELSGLAKLQKQRVSKTLVENRGNITPPTQLNWAFLSVFIFLVIGSLVQFSGFSDKIFSEKKINEESEKIIFKATDSISTEIIPPTIEAQQIRINYPAYTNIAAETTSEMDIKAVEGSQVSWELEFNKRPDAVILESMGNTYTMHSNGKIFTGKTTLTTSGFYNFRFNDSLGKSYVSELHSIEVIKDGSPVIEIENLKQFSSFNFGDNKELQFTTYINDDFGIADAYIIATVSQGSGESVKFREEKIEFDEDISAGNKTLELSKTLDLDEMKMEPGDELYFYVEVVDLKQPRANRARSETYFAVIKDTVSDNFEVEGSLGVELMPDYFRSQRQLIIDTEALISEKPEISRDEFNSRSNELGADQKALRLKYGQFMGDESETLTDGEIELEQGETDPLAEYTHDHDGDNEHNLVANEDDDHEHENEEEGDEEDPLEEYLHNHDDPEESSLFTDSLKSKLRQALNIMWDAELHLRMYAPGKSLPYQYEVLELIQEIKNSARIYVHRIGFDPPPIKEDVRLTGEIEEVQNYQKTEDFEKEEKYAFMKLAILRLEEIISEAVDISAADRELFGKAGDELAALAIEKPGKHLESLQQLKRLSENSGNNEVNLKKVQRELVLALPDGQTKPGRGEGFTGDLDKLLLKELETNE